ncbi:hypothetical protein RI367_001449 [Sorochytrium milnesiophthora]
MGGPSAGGFTGTTGPDPYAFRPPRIPGTYKYAGKFMGAVMWFWMMYQAKQNLPVMLGWRHPWEHHGHGHGHGDGHGHGHDDKAPSDTPTH